MTGDLNILWPLLLVRRPKARLGLSNGKPAVYRWSSDSGSWPLVADSWEEVLREALELTGAGKLGEAKKLPTIEEMSGSIDFGGLARYDIEAGEFVVLPRDEAAKMGSVETEKGKI